MDGAKSDIALKKGKEKKKSKLQQLAKLIFFSFGDFNHLLGACFFTRPEAQRLIMISSDMNIWVKFTFAKSTCKGRVAKVIIHLTKLIIYRCGTLRSYYKHKPTKKKLPRFHQRRFAKHTVLS